MAHVEAAAQAPASLNVEVIHCASPGVCERVALCLVPGATLGEALQRSGLMLRHGLALETVRAGIWGKLRAHDVALREHDRIEIYRPLTVDPKEARRLRYKRQRQKSSAA